MKSILIEAVGNQTISDADIRMIMCQVLNERNLELKEVTERGGISYDAFWSQLNQRTRGILAYAIPAFVRGSGDSRVLDLICEACGYKAILDRDYGEASIESIRKQELGFVNVVSNAIEIIEGALEDGVFDKVEEKKIYRALNKISKKRIALKLSIKEKARL